jgi:glycine dehydrogenase subunit 2
MKCNRKINEDIAKPDGFMDLHSISHESCIQRVLQMTYELEQDLK